MILEDRIELENRVFNIYTYSLKDKKAIYSVIYIQDAEKCNIISSYLEENVKGEEYMKSTHESMLSRLFKALRKNPEEPEKEILSEDTTNNKNIEEIEEEINESEGNNSEVSDDKIIVTFENNSEWIEFCKSNAPKFIKFTFLVDSEGIKSFGVESFSDKLKSDILYLKEFENKNISIINKIIGNPKSIISVTEDGLYFLYNIADEYNLIIYTEKGPIGLYIKDLDLFKEKVKKYIEN